jgi:hypothetical protein
MVPSLVGLLGLSFRYKRFLSCFGCCSQPSINYFFSPHTFSLCMFLSPSNSGRQSCWVACLLVCVSGTGRKNAKTTVKIVVFIVIPLVHLYNSYSLRYSLTGEKSIGEGKKCRGARERWKKGCCKVGKISPFLVRGNVPRQMANNRSQETLPARRDHHTVQLLKQ